MRNDEAIQIKTLVTYVRLNKTTEMFKKKQTQKQVTSNNNKILPILNKYDIGLLATLSSLRPEWVVS